MILKLLVHFYAWVWNVEPWVPSGSFDSGFVMVLGVLLLDLPVLASIVYVTVMYIKYRLSNRK